ncbi:MAG: tRNA (N(6)-L-threonylcarbamoyladenosine(37)-C(2))-methylthiotransferase MtaB [Gammaproteobacteria bacterium]|nr:tRNA (N(6)-L-threonylcarbamoyladenosine(37)-C(2))-methylthiotransferase MtaB [Gammaproteobacteria bacterium]
MEKVLRSTSARRSGISSGAHSGGTFSIATLGCKVNAFESEQLAQQFRARGRRDAAGGRADVCGINTCSVTAEADRPGRQLVRRAARQNPGARVVVTGCYAHLAPRECAEIPGVDLVVGNRGKANIPRLLEQLEEGGISPGAVAEDDDAAPPSMPQTLGGFGSRARAYLQIQQGCDRGCTFCVIHKARGPSYSFPAKLVREQAERLIRRGHRELVLCGVDIGAYGEDFAGGGRDHLAELLKQLAALDGDFRLRISSIDPAHLSDRLVQTLAAEPRICPQLHLSLQSANTLILKRMKRRATREMVYARVAKLREALPELVLGADILVGFPTESDAHFRQTLDAVGELEIAYPHVFAYSPRAGTPAARIPAQVPAPERKRRAALVRARGRAVWRAVAARQLGARLRVLVESRARLPAGFAYARAANYFPVVFPSAQGPAARSGDWAEVVVRAIDAGTAGDALLARRAV